MPSAVAELRAQVREELRLLDVKDAAWEDPKALINEITYFDPVTQKWVEFRMFPPEGWESPVVYLPNGDFKFVDTGAQDWFWQALVIDWFHDPVLRKFLILKARQLGITLLSCAYGLWLMLFAPGTATVAYSYEEGEAKKLVEAAWMMYLSLPTLLKNHVEVVSPSRADMPAEWIKLRHKEDGRISSFQALPATKKHGHGTRVTFGIMDEVARMDYAREIYTAVNPATSRGGKLVMISTANGVSNKESGEGNFFHHLYVTKKEKGLSFKFLPWNLEPSRKGKWYEREAMALDEVERNQQYPLNENDAFMLSGALYFNRESLDYYRGEVIDPLFQGQFVVAGRRKARFMKLRDGIIEVYEKPRDNGVYGLAVDTSTGKGTDYTSADVIDFSSGAICAHLHAKIEAPRAAVQVHFLGKWYNGAKVAVERGGGYGDALIIALRDGNDNVPPYPMLYRHTQFARGNKPISEEYGFPMSEKTRPQVLEGLKTWIRQRLFPWLGAGHVDELGTFIYADTKPSPRAQDGCNDDRVMSLAIAVELFRQYGQRPDKKKKWKQAKYSPLPTRKEF